MYLNDRAYYIQSHWTVQLEKTYLSILVSATKNISTCLSIISLRLSNLFLIELMFKNEKKMTLLQFLILRDFSSAKEFVGCSCAIGKMDSSSNQFNYIFIPNCLYTN